VVPAAGTAQFLVQIDGVRAAEVSSLPVVPSRGLGTLAQTLTELGLEAGRLGVEKDSVTVAWYERFSSRLPGATLVDIGADVLNLRMLKSDAEVEVVKHAAAISDQLFVRLREIAVPGVTEIELHQELVGLQRALGGDGLMSKHGVNDRTVESAWLASGPNTTQVSGYWLTMSGPGPSVGRPYGPTRRQLERGDLICLDVGTSVSGYHSDSARTYVLGPADQRQRAAWSALQVMQDAAVAELVPGRPVAAAYEAALAVARDLGVEEHFMTRALYDFPYVGHGVGVEIDEPPLLSPRDSSVIAAGMVLAVEPKLIDPSWGGLTVEDTVLVTDQGPVRLTRADRELEMPV